MFFITVFLFLLALPQVAFAYIDPGSGSAIISAIIGFFVAAGLVVKTYWYKLKALVCRSKKNETGGDIEN